MWDGLIAGIATGILSLVGVLIVSRRDKQTKYLLSDCRLAVRALKEFRVQEEMYAQRVAELEGDPSRKEAIRLRFRSKVKINDFGQEKRISNLLERLSS